MARLPDQKLASGVPAKPPALTKKESAEWDRIVRELLDSNIKLSTAHRSLIENAACIAVEIADAKEVIELEGRYLVNPKTGVAAAHPAAKRMDNLRRDYVRIMSLLGMRSAPTVPGGDKKKSMSDLLNG
jgi:phage terminase small subunit